MRWLRDQLNAKFEMKTTLVGHSCDPDVVTEGKILNRIIRATPLGWEYEWDQRHVEVMVEVLGLNKCCPVAAPGVDDNGGDGDDALLSEEDSTTYRDLAARANYLSIDRADAHFGDSIIVPGYE